MNEENKIKQPVILVALTILIMYAVSFIPGDVEVLGIKLKNVDIFSDLKEQKEEKQIDKKYKYDPNFDFGYNMKSDNQDSDFTAGEERNIQLASFSGLSGFLNWFSADADASFTSRSPNLKKEKIRGNTKQMAGFFDALKYANRKTVRVAHIGDSIIDGDLVTKALRRKLQKKFGGDAVGFISLTYKGNHFRYTTNHEYDRSDWRTVSFDRNLKQHLIGTDGIVSIPKLGAKVEFTATEIEPYLDGYKEVRLFYSDAKASSFTYSFDGGAKKTAQMKTGSGIQETVLKAPGVAKKITFEFPVNEQAVINGVSLEKSPGVYVDNLAYRGKTGVRLTKVPEEGLKDFQKLLDYKLVIFQFGLNVIDEIGKNPELYETSMIKSIEHFKKSMPGAAFLMVSVNDKGFKDGTKIVTDPDVFLLLGVQQKIAKETNIAFWNLFEAMGGENSMESWVKSNPPLANSDYTHFSDQGADLVGEMLAEALIDAYSKN